MAGGLRGLDGALPLEHEHRRLRHSNRLADANCPEFSSRDETSEREHRDAPPPRQFGQPQHSVGLRQHHEWSYVTREGGVKPSVRNHLTIQNVASMRLEVLGTWRCHCEISKRPDSLTIQVVPNKVIHVTAPAMTAPHAMLVAASGRAGAAARARLDGLVTGATRVVRARRRRAGASENLVEQILAEGVETVIVESVSVFSPSAAKSLGIVAALRSAGVTVLSLTDGALVAGDIGTLAAVAAFLAAVEQRSASKRGRAAIAVARANQRRVGRPKKPVDLVRARALVEQHGSIRRAAREMNLGATSLRRALQRAA